MSIIRRGSAGSEGEHMNTVITIGRQFGSGGRELGHKLARELQVAYYDKQIISEIVDQTDFSKEYVKEVLENRMSYALPASFAQSMSFGNEHMLGQMQKIVKAQTDVIKEMALKSSCVIVGRCADYILKDFEEINLIRLFVYSEMDSRIQRCMDRAPEGEDFTYRQMRRHIKRVDKKRSRYYSDFTLQKWGDKDFYDICINTAHIDIDKIVPDLAKMFK